MAGLYNPAMLLRVKKVTEKLKELRDWTLNQVGKRSAIGLVLLIYCLIPDWEGRNAYWHDHLPWIKLFVSNHFRELLIVAGMGIIFFDHRRLVKQRDPEKYDPNSLKGRTLKLRDDMQKFLDSVGPKPEEKQAGETQREYYERAVETSTRRAGQLIHGYDWRFSNDVLRIYNEYGENGLLDGELTDVVARQFKNEDAYISIIKSLSNLAEKADVSCANAPSIRVAPVTVQPVNPKVEHTHATAQKPGIVKKGPNIVATKEAVTRLYFDGETDKFIEATMNGSAPALIACFRNEPIAGQKVLDAEYLRAQITYYDGSGKEVGNIGKACWVGEYQDTTEIPVGEDGCVVLAVVHDDKFIAPFKKRGPSESMLGGEVIYCKYHDLGTNVTKIKVTLLDDSVAIMVSYNVDVSAGLTITRYVDPPA